MADHVHAPDIQNQTIYQCGASYGSESPCGREGDLIMPEIEQSCGDGAEDDGEFKPGEESAFGCEEDFGLNPDGDVDPCGPRLETWSLLGLRGR